jgi:hypothetical protein
MKMFQPINKREKAHEAVLKPVFYIISEDKVKTSQIPLHTRSLVKGQRNVKVTLSIVDDAGHTQSARDVYSLTTGSFVHPLTDVITDRSAGNNAYWT